MRLTKLNAIMRAYTSNLQDSATPSSISYAYNFGSLLGLIFTVMLATGFLLAWHYIGTASTAFNSVDHIMNDVSNGSWLRYVHANGASFVFIFIYAHIFRNLYYSSYKAPRSATWLVGNVIVVLAIGTAFLGYSLVFGQMSLWGATVISNLATALPYIGVDIATILWGAFSVGSSTLTRFFALHYALAIFVIALAVVHLLLLHMHASSSPLGITGSNDKIAMQPLFLVKDAITILLAIAAIIALVAYLPNLLGHSDNFIEANSMQTPASIVPEWYLLPFYAILRSVPSKLIGVALMLFAIIWLAAMIFDSAIIRSHNFKLIARVLLATGFYAFVILLSLGAKHIEAPYVLLGQISTLIYFATLLFMLPSAGLFENSLLSISKREATSNTPLILGAFKVSKPLHYNIVCALKPHPRLTKEEALAIKLTSHQAQALHGIMLSDGYLEPSSSGNPKFKFKQTADLAWHVDYFKVVSDLFENLCTPIGKEKIVANNSKTSLHNSIVLATRNLPCLSVFRNLYYNENGTKMVPKNIKQFLTEIGLAHFIMGDASSCASFVNSNKVRIVQKLLILLFSYTASLLTRTREQSKGLILCTESFDKDSIELLLDTLRSKFVLRCTLTAKNRIYIAEKSMSTLRALVLPHMTKSMYYKLGIVDVNNTFINSSNTKSLTPAFFA